MYETIMLHFLGAHRSLTTTQRQQLSIKEGALAPVLASVSLFGCYLVVTYLPDFNFQVISQTIVTIYCGRVIIYCVFSILYCYNKNANSNFFSSPSIFLHAIDGTQCIFLAVGVIRCDRGVRASAEEGLRSPPG